MNYLIVFVAIVLVFQLSLMFLIRYKKKMDKKNNVLMKYDINTPKDAWECLNNPNIPESDKEKIQEYYASFQGK